MKNWVYWIGALVLLVLLFSNGIIGGALCVRSIGCVYSTGTGVSVDSGQTKTISVERR